jgi:hypothetical protein
MQHTNAHAFSHCGDCSNASFMFSLPALNTAYVHANRARQNA